MPIYTCWGSGPRSLLSLIIEGYTGFCSCYTRVNLKPLEEIGLIFALISPEQFHWSSAGINQRSSTDDNRAALIDTRPGDFSGITSDVHWGVRWGSRPVDSTIVTGWQPAMCRETAKGRCTTSAHVGFKWNISGAQVFCARGNFTHSEQNPAQRPTTLICL